MWTRITICFVIALLVGHLLESDAAAQGVGSRGTTSSGMFGSRTVGSGQGLSAGTRNAFGAQNQAQGALGQTSAGSRIDELIGAGTAGGTVDGSERFLRGNRDATQFVGSTGSQAGFIGAATTAGGLNNFNSAQFNFGNNARNNRQNAQPGGNGNNFGRGQRNITVRTKLSIGFRYQPLRQNAIQTSVQKYLNGSDSIGRLGTIQVDLVGRTATLRGSVATESDRALAVRLARLEPGVSQVVDQLSVLSPESDAPSPSDP